jgi:hypothetical protein
MKIYLSNTNIYAFVYRKPIGINGTQKEASIQALIAWNTMSSCKVSEAGKKIAGPD